MTTETRSQLACLLAIVASAVIGWIVVAVVIPGVL